MTNQPEQFCIGHMASHYLSSFYSEYPMCKEAGRDMKLRGQFSISADEYDSMLEAQGYCCALCGKSEVENAMTKADGSVKPRKLAVDHWHGCTHQPTDKHLSCGRCIRALLCNEDNIQLTEAVEKYLLSLTSFEVIEKYGEASKELRQWRYLMRFNRRMQEDIPPYGLDYFPNSPVFENSVRRYTEELHYMSSAVGIA
ncbi:hypothetical protein ITP53_25950 [Nonomuraea sp. K274]|uniref:Uncharacterized protein n=1 Tax=Nonomuraea cypriaca TaxID=1187855 RepID=A0A931ADJ4_9ACTN|nr:endonuclease domain-containing protein [Nonomuraea cypriaca]MBF8189114.1 hypothetical protein [Nonomuraea cypriaca]